jgi:hypothetical protein
MIKKLLTLAAFSFLFAVPSHAQATGSCNTASCVSPDCTQADYLAALPSPSNTNANVTVAIPSCGGTTSSTAIQWVANLFTADGYTPPSAVRNLTINGQTTCTGGGTSSASCVDNTNITLIGASTVSTATHPALNLVCATTTTLITLNGFTFYYTGANNGGANIPGFSFNSGNAQTPIPTAPCFRMTNSHIVINTTGSGNSSPYACSVDNVYGLFDHNLFVDNDTSSASGVCEPFGDGFTHGFLGWQTPLAFGTNQAIYFELDTFLFPNAPAGGSTEGPFDSYAAARTVIRFCYISNAHFGSHGTDSGNYRSAFSQETYGNNLNNSTASAAVAGGIRGGALLAWGNTYGGTGGYGGINLTIDRAPGAGFPDAGNFGMVDGTQWLMGNQVINSSNIGGCGNSGVYTRINCNATLGGDWSALPSGTNAIAAGTSIIPSAGNAGSYNFTTLSACTKDGTEPSTWNQGLYASTTDGTCVWHNEYGNPSAAAVANWCAVSLDFPATTNSQCPLFPGNPNDTATGFFDGPLASVGGTSGGGYPARDMPGRTHNQQFAPAYSWEQTGGGALGQDTGNTFDIANQDYFNGVSSGFNGTVGVGWGALAARPSTCTPGPGGSWFTNPIVSGSPGVGYFATDQGSWNTSGNGFGQGELFVCSATNTWSLYYTPYTYPHPLDTSSSVQGIGIALPPGFPW